MAKYFLLLAAMVMLLALSCAQSLEKTDLPHKEMSPQSQYETKCVNDQCVVYDKTTQLFWQRGFMETAKTLGYAMTIKEALIYCDELQYGGYDDWRLPTLEEVRTKIYGCDKVFNTTLCGIEALEEIETYVENCACATRKGPGEHGTYLYPGVWRNDAEFLSWTSSKTEKKGIPISAHFTIAVFAGIEEDTVPLQAGVRCVRKDEK